jgi:hypothetical protein
MGHEKDQSRQSPGTGSDKQRSETPPNANERAKKDRNKDKKIDEDPGSQMTG